MNRYMTICYLLLIAGIICWMSYTLLAHIDVNGVLIEPFVLIPLGYLFLGLGIIGVLIKIVVDFTKKVLKKFK